MGNHIWEWDGKSEEPMLVVCKNCSQRERLDWVLSEIGCKGCPAEGVQKSLFNNNNKVTGNKWPRLI